MPIPITIAIAKNMLKANDLISSGPKLPLVFINKNADRSVPPKTDIIISNIFLVSNFFIGVNLILKQKITTADI